MEYFHGSTVCGLTELRPFASASSNLREPLVYLTSSRQLAAHYIWDEKRIGVKMPMLDIRKDGVLVFQEMFSGALEYFYKGVSGCIYRCVGDYEISEDSGVMTCATSRHAVPITDFELIDDVYQRIISYADKGTFIYERFEDLPQSRIDMIRGQILRLIKRSGLLHDTTCAAYRFVQEKFPRYLLEAQVLDERGLL